MNKTAIVITDLIVTLLWGIFVLGGSVFLVVKYDWSLWTVFFGLLFCGSTAYVKKIAGVKEEDC